MSNKRIGFVDYRLDNFHAEVYLDALRGPLVGRGYEVVGATALQHEPSQKWAREKTLTYFKNIGDLADRVDFFIILAPSNPELHLKLCQTVFPFGKQTFVDKTFAPDLQTANKIFALADTHKIAIQSTSALRSSSVQKQLASNSSALDGMFITSSGPTFGEYGIHPVELAVSCLGAEIEGLMRLGSNEHPRFILMFSQQRTAIIDFNQAADVPYTATLVTGDGCQHVTVDTDSLFIDAAASILDFFDRQAATIDRRETLIVRRILDLAMQDDPVGKFVDLTDLTAEVRPLPAPHWKAKQVSKA